LKKTLEMRREKNIRLLRSELERILTELRELGAKKIIHFGSSVRGEAGLNSDLDLVVVMKSGDAQGEETTANCPGSSSVLRPQA
jgi:predicted nucleotidyltransferase